MSLDSAASCGAGVRIGRLLSDLFAPRNSESSLDLANPWSWRLTLRIIHNILLTLGHFLDEVRVGRQPHAHTLAILGDQRDGLAEAGIVQPAPVIAARFPVRNSEPGEAESFALRCRLAANDGTVGLRDLH